jgi:hypothetical protein
MARPIYYGMLLFAQAGAGQLVEAKLEPGDHAGLLTAYGIRNNAGAIKVAVFNKHVDRGVRLAIDAGRGGQGVSSLHLQAPRVDSTTDATFGGAPVGASGAWSATRDETPAVENGAAVIEMPAASAALVTFEPE